jgi:hypothetical protein
MTTSDQIILGSTVVESELLGTVIGVGAKNRAYVPPSKGGHAGRYSGRGLWRSCQGPLYFSNRLVGNLPTDSRKSRKQVADKFNTFSL